MLERVKSRTRHESPGIVPTLSASRKNPSASNYTDGSKAAHDHDKNTFEDVASRLKQEAKEPDDREAASRKVENDTYMRTNDIIKQTAGLDRRAKTLSKAEFQIGVRVTELDHKQGDLDERENILAEAEQNNTMRTEVLDKKAADLDEREEAIIFREKSAVTAGESMIGQLSSAGHNLRYLFDEFTGCTVPVSVLDIPRSGSNPSAEKLVVCIGSGRRVSAVDPRNRRADLKNACLVQSNTEITKLAIAETIRKLESVGQTVSTDTHAATTDADAPIIHQTTVTGTPSSIKLNAESKGAAEEVLGEMSKSAVTMPVHMLPLMPGDEMIFSHDPVPKKPGSKPDPKETVVADPGSVFISNLRTKYTEPRNRRASLKRTAVVEETKAQMMENAIAESETHPHSTQYTNPQGEIADGKDGSKGRGGQSWHMEHG